MPQLVRATPNVRAEQKLVDVVQQLGRMGVQILPVQVRLAKDPMQLIVKALPAAYAKVGGKADCTYDHFRCHT